MATPSERVRLRPLTRADLDAIEAWTPHQDPLYRAWNRFPWQVLGKDLWHALEAADPAIERLAVVDGADRVIGVIGLVGVAGEGARMRTLSIFLGADYVGRGLGSEALRAVLRRAFAEQRLAAVCLDVAATNLRARRAYEKCGFRVTGARYRPLEEGQSPATLDEARAADRRPYWREIEGRTYALFYRMQIRARTWRLLEQERNRGQVHT